MSGYQKEEWQGDISELFRAIRLTINNYFIWYVARCDCYIIVGEQIESSEHGHRINYSSIYQIWTNKIIEDMNAIHFMKELQEKKKKTLTVLI